MVGEEVEVPDEVAPEVVPEAALVRARWWRGRRRHRYDRQGGQGGHRTDVRRGASHRGRGLDLTRTRDVPGPPEPAGHLHHALSRCKPRTTAAPTCFRRAAGAPATRDPGGLSLPG